LEEQVVLKKRGEVVLKHEVVKEWVVVGCRPLFLNTI